jgi:hypothetical protein
MVWIGLGDRDKLTEDLLDASIITYLAEMAGIPFQVANCLS